MSGEELRAALELITFGIRDVSPSEPDERMIPTQHSVGSIRKARAALAAPSTPEPSGLRAAAERLVNLRDTGWTTDSEQAAWAGLRAALAAPSTPEPSGPTCNFDCDACRAESD